MKYLIAIAKLFIPASPVGENSFPHGIKFFSKGILFFGGNLMFESAFISLDSHSSCQDNKVYMLNFINKFNKLQVVLISHKVRA
jgi:hypothetical protein